MSYHGPKFSSLPVELFGAIISNLSRQDTKRLRLVSKECEAKVSIYYFAEVVVPFRSQTRHSLERDKNGDRKNMSESMFFGGHRVFDSFGRFVRRFALSLELDEEELEFPPTKPTQAIHSSFWGLYRWPYEHYNGCTDSRVIDSRAGGTEDMVKTLRCLSEVMTLGLCSDAGLGFLCGPDFNARNNAIQHRLFSDRSWKSRSVFKESTAVVTVADAKIAAGLVPRNAGRVPENWKQDVLFAMLKSAGFTETQRDEALAFLLKSENATEANIALDGDPSPDLPEGQNLLNSGTLLPLFKALGVDPDLGYHFSCPLTTNSALVPVALSKGQKEMLAEMDRAHCAMTQSYMCSAAVCARNGSFQYLTTLNIAKIPSSHLSIIDCASFWGAFPNLRNVSLGVIADWRRLRHTTSGSIEDIPVSPVAAVPLVHELIFEHISIRPNIESFHFEWICGGELASGAHQRNQHILPLPLFSNPEFMTFPIMNPVGGDHNLLHFPHLKHLSLKNGWVAPHVLLQSLRCFALCALEKVEFEGISLSVTPGVRLQSPPPLNVTNLGIHNTLNNGINLIGRAVPSSHWDNVLPLRQPSWLSWAGIIEHFSPCIKVRHWLENGSTEEWQRRVLDNRRTALESLSAIIPDAQQLPQDEARYKLQSLSFKSCGYVTLPHPIFDINSMIPVAELALVANSFPIASAFAPMMQQCSHPLAGRVVPFFMLNDRKPLLAVFNFKEGWGGVYEEQIIEHAKQEGFRRVGEGRFSGVLERLARKRKR